MNRCNLNKRFMILNASIRETKVSGMINIAECQISSFFILLIELNHLSFWGKKEEEDQIFWCSCSNASASKPGQVLKSIIRS